MTQITLPTGCYLLVEIKPDWFDFEFNEGDRTALMFLTQTEIRHITVPEGQWSIIGKGNELKEDDWKGIVERWDCGKYNDYSRHLARVDTPTESGLSILACENLNPSTTLILKKIQP